MSNGWIDIDDCTSGYWLFKLKSTYSSDVVLPVEVSGGGIVYFTNGRPCDHLYNLFGKALKLADINNNGEVLVEKKK